MIGERARLERFSASWEQAVQHGCDVLGKCLLIKSLLRALSSFTHFKTAEMKTEAKQQASCLDK